MTTEQLNRIRAVLDRLAGSPDRTQRARWLRLAMLMESRVELTGPDRVAVEECAVGLLLGAVRHKWPGVGVHHDSVAGGWVFAGALDLPPELRSVVESSEIDALLAALDLALRGAE
jgi:hypothetical protein